MRLNRVTTLLGVSALWLCATAQDARAEFALRIEYQDSNGNWQRLDGDLSASGTQDFYDWVLATNTNSTSEDGNKFANQIQFDSVNYSVFPLGNVTLSVTAQSTETSSGSKLYQVSTAANNNTSTDITFRVSATDYFSTPVQEGKILLSTTVLNDDITKVSDTVFQSYVKKDATGSASDEFNTSGDVVTTGAQTVTTTTQTVYQNFEDSGVYQTTTVMTFTIKAGKSFTGLNGTAEVVAAPAPASAIMALAGLPMIGLFGWMRRRKAVAPIASVA